MPGNSFGTIFRVTTWGESHGAAVGVVVDGCPPLLALSEADIQPDLDRRAPGQSALVTQRKESDTVRILSGVFEGKTLGTPISLMIENEDMRPGDYREVQRKVPAEPRRLHLRRQVRHPRLARRGPHQRARDRRPRRRRAPSRASSSPTRWGVEVVAWVSKVGRLVVDCDVERVTRAEVDADADPLPRARRRRAHDRGRGGRAQGRQLARRRRRLRGRAAARRAGASPSSTGWRPTSPGPC